MFALKNFEISSRSPAPGPSDGGQDFNVFFFEFAKRSLAEGVGPVAPPPPRATGGLPPYISPVLHSLLI